MYSYKNFDICSLKVACPTAGDELGFLIDDKMFSGEEFNNIDDAIEAIDDRQLEDYVKSIYGVK